MYKTDLHLHTTASDGSDTPTELVALARNAGLELIAVTDHDTLVGSAEAVKLSTDALKIITGIEFSCHSFGEGDFDCHILGYGFDPQCPELLAAISHGRQMRLEKLEARLGYLEKRFGIVFDKEELEWLHSLNSAAKPHLARLIVKRGLAGSLADAIDLYLKGDGFPDDRIDAGEAIRAILAAGGIPVYAHPLGGEREERLDIKELERRIDVLAPLGLKGLECYYSRYSVKDEELLLTLANGRGLLASAGSDYHGKNKTVRLGKLSSDNDVCPEDISIISALFAE